MGHSLVLFVPDTEQTLACDVHDIENATHHDDTSSGCTPPESPTDLDPNYDIYGTAVETLKSHYTVTYCLQ